MNTLVKEIFDKKIFLKETSNNIIKYKRYDEYNCAINIILFNNDKNINITGKNDKIYTSMIISYLLSGIAIEHKIKTIKLTLVNIIADKEILEEYINTNEIKYFYKNIYTKNNPNKILINVKESFYKEIKLINVLDNNKLKKNIKKLLFQILFTLTHIQNKFPGFRHNNLSIDTIDVYLKKEDSFDEYYINNKKYYLYKNDFDIKLDNFENSEIIGIVENSSVNKYKKNRSYDFYFFINSLMKKSNLTNEMKQDKELNNFINKYYDKKNENIETYKPSEILKDEYFLDLTVEYKKSDFLLESNKYITGKRLINTNNINKINKIFRRNIGVLSSNNNIVQHGGYNELFENEYIQTESNYSEINNNEQLQIQDTINQEGGFKVQPQYKKDFNNPQISNDERNIYRRQQNEKPPNKQPILVEQTIYDTQKSAPPKPTYPPEVVPVPNPYYPMMNPTFAYGYKPNKVPIIKQYNVNLSNPSGDHVAVSRIFEDMIPGKDRPYTFNTLNERINIINFLRRSIVKVHDGEDMSISGGDNSLLSYFRLMQINPYSLERNPYTKLSDKILIFSSSYPIRYDHTKNEINLAKNAEGYNVRIYNMNLAEIYVNQLNKNLNNKMSFDIWREVAFYEYVRERILKTKKSPNFLSIIFYKLDSDTKPDFNQIKMIKNDPTIDVNYRKRLENILNMKHDITEYLDPRSTIGLNYHYIEINRVFVEIFIYINQNIYSLSSNADTVNKLKHIQYEILDIDKKFIKKVELVTKVDGIKALLGEISYITNPNSNYYNIYQELVNKINKLYRYISKSLDKIYIGYNLNRKDMTVNSGKCLVMVTEGPTDNILSWATKKYDTFGIVHKMKNTGFHTDEIWENILFQLCAALIVLHDSGIRIKDFSLENNVYIKDLNTDPNITGYWKYKYYNLDYYIPNYGYLVVIDSIYKDRTWQDERIDNNDTNAMITDRDFKIESILYRSNNGGYINDDDSNEVQLKHKIKRDIHNLFQEDNFTNINECGYQAPSDKILKIIGKIRESFDPNQPDNNVNNTNKKNLRDILPNCFNKYLHNKCGSILTKKEVERLKSQYNINNTINTSIKTGDLIVYTYRNNRYFWGIFLNNNSNRYCNIITTTSFDTYDNDSEIPKLDIVSVRRASISSYIGNGYMVEQNFDPRKSNLVESELLETYIFP